MFDAQRGSLAVVATLTFAYLLSYPLAIGRADESHLLYGAKRVLEGQVIYKDFWEVLTPLSYYLFAGIYRIAGTTLLAARVGIALIDALGAALLFHLVRRVSGAAEATLAALVFAGLCVPTWPYASPHWISTTLGLLVATVLLAETWQRSSRARPFLAGMLAGAAVCVQQQRGFFLAVWLPVAILVLASGLPRAARWRVLRTEIAWGAAGGALVTLVVLGHAAWAASPTLLVDAIVGFPLKHYGPTTAGTIPWAFVFAMTGLWRPYAWLWLLRVSPLFLVAEGFLLARRRPWARPERVRACLWLLAALMALSVWYLPDFIHVSFVLPFLLVPGAGTLHALRFAPTWSRHPAGRHAVTLGMWVFGLALVGKGVANLAHAQAQAPVRFETAFGALRGDEAAERLFRAVRRHLVREPAGRSMLFSYPDDAWLYLALPADDATRFSVLVAGFFPPEDVEEVVEVLRARRPGTVVLNLPFRADSLRNAVEQGYDAVEEIHPYRIYVRRDAGSVGVGGTP